MERSKRNLILEIMAVALISILFLVVLVSSYSIKAWSDPAHWYGFGMNFFSNFGKSALAYGFPFLIFMASKIVGPFYAFLVTPPNTASTQSHGTHDS